MKRCLLKPCGHPRSEFVGLSSCGNTVHWCNCCGAILFNLALGKWRYPKRAYVDSSRKVCKHGAVGEHFVCKVRDWKVQIGALSDVAWSWHFIVKIRKDTDPLAFGFPCRVYREESANG